MGYRLTHVCVLLVVGREDYITAHMDISSEPGGAQFGVRQRPVHHLALDNMRTPRNQQDPTLRLVRNQDLTHFTHGKAQWKCSQGESCY